MSQVEENQPLVHQIWFSLLPDPSTLPDNCKAIADVVGESRYKLWTLTSARRLLQEHFDDSTVSAFDRLKPLAFKADLARYCIVHHFGGFYLDQSVTNVILPETDAYDFIGFSDPNAENSSWKVANNYFFARANSTILNDAIQQVLYNCQREYYGKDPHYPTGPSVLGRSVAGLAPDLNVLLGHYIWLRRRRNKYLLPGYGVVGRGKVGGHLRGGVSGIPGGNNYNELWRDRDVYQ